MWWISLIAVGRVGLLFTALRGEVKGFGVVWLEEGFAEEASPFSRRTHPLLHLAE